MQLTHELYPLPMAPVLRTLMQLYLTPDADEDNLPVVTLEMFTNVGDDAQAQEFQALTAQAALDLYIYDQHYVLCKAQRFSYSQGVQARWLLAQARYLYAQTSSSEFDFEAAKSYVLERLRL